MATKLTLTAEEGSAYTITVALTDEDDGAVTPIGMTWTLTDAYDNTINSREDVDFEADDGTGSAGTLGTSMDIVLNGADLAITDAAIAGKESRWLLAEGTYTSDKGTGLPFRSMVGFSVENLPKS